MATIDRLERENYSDVKNCASQHVENCEMDLAIGLFSGASINKGRPIDISESREILKIKSSDLRARFLLGLTYIIYDKLSKAGAGPVLSSCKEGLKDACYYITDNIQDYDSSCRDKSCYSFIYAMNKSVE